MAGKSVLEDEIADLVMRPEDGVLVERVERVMPGPFIDDADGLELRDPCRDGRPDMVLPAVMIHDEIIVIHRWIRVGRTACQIGRRPVLAEMHARRVDGQRQVAIERGLGGKDPAEALSRLDRHIDTRHRRRACGTRAAGIDHGAA